MGAILTKRGKYRDASRAFDEAINTAQQLKDKECTLDSFYEKAFVLLYLKDFVGARRYLKRAYKIKCPKPDKLSQTLRALKICTLICADQEALLKSEDLQTKIELCDKLGDHFVALKIFNVAVEFYKFELEYALEHRSSTKQLAVIYVSIAQTCLDAGLIDEALFYFEKELTCHEDNKVEKYKTLLKITDLKSQKQIDMKEIIDNYEEILQSSEKEDQSLYQDTIFAYSSHLKKHNIYDERIENLKNRLESIEDNMDESSNDSIEEKETGEDEYDKINLEDFIFSESSDEDLDEKEEVSAKRTRRVKKKGVSLKLNEMGETPLHRACIAGKVKVVEKFIKDGHPINVRDYCGWIPLHEAVNHGHLEIVQLLLKHGAHVNDPGGSKCDGITPLHDACNNGHVDIARLLVEKGANLIALTHSNETPLDCLLNWRSRSASLSDRDVEDFELLKGQMQEGMTRLGFSKLPNKKRQRNSSSSSTSSVEVSVSKNKSNKYQLRDPIYDSDDDFTNGVKMYRNAIRGAYKPNNPFDVEIEEDSLAKSQKKSALVNENDDNRDDWLVEDCRVGDSRVRDVYECLSSTKPLEASFRVTSVSAKNNKRKKKEDANVGINILKETETCNQGKTDDMCIVAESTCDKVSVVSSESSKRSTLSANSNSSKSSTMSSSIFRIRVEIDEETLLVPIPSINLTFAWLNKEVSQRYFSHHGMKPFLVLKTLDGALLDEQDNISIIGDERIKANIKGWDQLPPHDIYKEQCLTSGVEPLTELITEFQNISIYGKLKLSDINIPIKHITPLLNAMKYQSNLREIVSSTDCALNLLPCFLFLGFFFL